MNEKHKQLVATMQAKQATLAESVKALNENPTQEGVLNARKLRDEIGVLRDEIKVHTDAADLVGESEDFERFLNEPVRKTPYSTGASQKGQPPYYMPGGIDGFGTLGSVPAGHAELDYDRHGQLKTVFQNGDGIFGEEKWKAIRSEEYFKAFCMYLRMGRTDLPYPQRKNLEAGNDTQGGFLIPVDSLMRIIQRKPTPTRVAGFVQSINTARDFVEMVKVNYSSDNVYSTGFRVTKTGENPSSTTQARVADSNLFGTITIPVHTFMMTGILTNNQLEDSALDILNWVVGKYRETIDILYDDKYINGSGTGEPAGMLANPGGTDQPAIIYSGTASAPFLTADGLLNLNLDVPEQYDENCRYLFNKTGTHKVIRTLKDGQNRYLFGQGYQDSGLVRGSSGGRPTDLDGYPYSWSQLMPSPANNAYPVLFGDFNGYMGVNRIGFSIQVARELYAELNQVALIGRVRFGGAVIEPWRLRIQQCHT